MGGFACAQVQEGVIVGAMLELWVLVGVDGCSVDLVFVVGVDGVVIVCWMLL